MTTLTQSNYKEGIVHSSSAWLMYVQIFSASIFMVLCSQIKIVLPFTLVPITFQTLAVMLIGATLGSRKAFLAILCYFAEILLGLPVLSGGSIDPFVFIGPKGGYVLGFSLQAFVMGWFVEKVTLAKPFNFLIGGLLSCVIQMGFGVCVLALFVGWDLVWIMGLYPFIVGEILKVLMIAFGLYSLSSNLLIQKFKLKLTGFKT